MPRSVLPLLFLFLTTHAQAQSLDAGSDLSYTPNRASAEQMKRAVVARVSQGNPQAGLLLAKALSGKDVSALFEQAAAPYHLHDGNLADAITARDLMKQMREAGSPPPALAEIEQRRESTARALQAQSGPRLEAKRRELAEIAQIGFVIDYLAWTHAQQQASGSSAAAQASETAPREHADAPLETERSANLAMPIGAATQSAGNFTPMGSTIHVEAWYLYPGGIATDCSAHDPETLHISLVALRAMRDCTGARWRRGSRGIQIQVGDRDPWNDAREQPAQTPGTRIQFSGETAGGAGTAPGGAGVSVNTVNGGRLILTSDGRIRTTLASATSIGGQGVGGGSSSNQSFSGTYTINGYMMTITAPSGQTLNRLVTVVHENGQTYVYFQHREYWPSKR